MRKTLIWLFLNFVGVVLLYLTGMGIQGAWNALRLLIMFNLFIVILVISMGKDRWAVTSPPVPLGIIFVYDVTYSVALAWIGHLGWAALYLLTGCLQTGVYAYKKEEEEEPENG